MTLVGCEITYEDTGPLPYGDRRDEPVERSGNPLPRPGEHPAVDQHGDPVEPGKRPGPGPDMRETPSVDVPPPVPTHKDSVHVTSSTGEYHKAGCTLATGTTRPFETAYDALDAGFLPCQTCRPGP